MSESQEVYMTPYRNKKFGLSSDYLADGGPGLF